MTDQSLTLEAKKQIEVPKDNECRWVVTLFSDKEIVITDREKEIIDQSLIERKGAIFLDRGTFTASSISSVLYRPLVEHGYKDPFKEEKRVNYEIDPVTGVAKIVEENNT